MYHVTVTPNPSTCSRDVTPSENYSCPGLALGTKYAFTVSAINCGYQEGMEYTFTVQPQGKIIAHCRNNRELLLAFLTISLL